MGLDVSQLAIPTFEDFEIIKSGLLTVSYPASGLQAVGNVTHNLGFVPAYLLYVKIGSSFYPTPFPVYITSGGNAGKLDTYYDAYSTITDFYCRVTVMTISPVYATNFSTTFKYFLLRNIAKST